MLITHVCGHTSEMNTDAPEIWEKKLCPFCKSFEKAKEKYRRPVRRYRMHYHDYKLMEDKPIIVPNTYNKTTKSIEVWLPLH